MRELTRREFIERAGTFAALAATAPVLGQTEPTPTPAPRGANERLRVAVVGVRQRTRGMAHVAGFAGRNNCVVTVVCDCDSADADFVIRDTAMRQGGVEPRFVQDFRRVVEDRDIDIISIATPNHWHALMAIWAMQNGKDVYVEKPVSHNVWEGRRIVAAVERYNKICQTGTQSRSMTGMRQSIQAIRDGRIGRVDLAYGVCYKRRNSIGRVNGEGVIPRTCDYDLWCGPAPRNPLRRQRLHYDWHWQWDTGNGDLGNQGIHEMDKARWGLGVAGLPQSFFSIGGRFGYVDDGETANTQLCHFDYGQAKIIFEVRGLPSTSPYPAAVRAGGNASTNFVGNIFFGSEGVLVCPNYSSGILLNPAGEIVERFNGGSDLAHFDNFINAVRTRRRDSLHADILEGHISSALCHLGNISYRLGREVPLAEVRDVADHRETREAFERMREHLRANNVDLQQVRCKVGPRLTINAQEQIPDHREAAQLLTREYRRGFEVPASF